VNDRRPSSSVVPEYQNDDYRKPKVEVRVECDGEGVVDGAVPSEVELVWIVEQSKARIVN
jgi:hypothetical protein